MRKLAVIFVLLALFFSRTILVRASECQLGTNDPLKSLEVCRDLLNKAQDQVNTLANQLEYLDNQITATTLEIQRNELEIEHLKTEIKNLGSRIKELNSTTDKITDIVKLKIERMYKRQQTNFVYTFMNAQNLPEFLRSIQYLRRSQISDRELLLKLQNTKVTFEEQKDLREEKEEELNQLTAKLESYQVELASQQRDKKQLLEVTRNDEKRYQQLIAELQAEAAAISAITSGQTAETELRSVKSGDTIASLISGASCNSTGTHLHFTVEDNGQIVNPFSYLKSVEYTDYTGGDAFNPSGNWEWPLNPPIEFNQGYGDTIFTRISPWYSFHNGIDLASGSNSVRTVADGTLYSGSYTGSNGCALLYVKVKHSDSNVNTYYLHAYSQ